MQKFIDKSEALQAQGIKKRSASGKRCILQYSSLFKVSLHSSVPKQGAANREEAHTKHQNSTVEYTSRPEMSGGSGKKTMVRMVADRSI